MSVTYKHQNQFSLELKAAWMDGKRERVRTVIRNLKNKAQAAYIASRVTLALLDEGHGFAQDFVEFMHPNN